MCKKNSLIVTELISKYTNMETIVKNPADMCAMFLVHGSLFWVSSG